MIQNLIYGILFFENIVSVLGTQLFYIRPHISVDIIAVFLFFNFLAESLEASKKLRKSSLVLKYSFPQKTSLIL